MNVAKEPVAIGGLVIALVNSVIQLLVLLGVVSLTADELAGVNIVLVNAVALITAIVSRSRVAPVGPNIDPDFGG